MMHLGPHAMLAQFDHDEAARGGFMTTIRQVTVAISR